MKRLFFLLLCLFGYHFISAQSDITGIWQGYLHIAKDSLAVVLVIDNKQDTLQVVMDSPDQFMTYIPVSKFSMMNDSVFVEVSSYNSIFNGKILPDLNQIKGTFMQNKVKFPLTLSRTNERKLFPRPQTPEPPFPYQTVDLKIDYSTDFPITGTLTLPQEKPLATVILITGSGRQDRDETIFNHKPFFVIADYLTKKGYAVFRYDDAPMQFFVKMTSHDFSDQVLTICDSLSSVPELSGVPMGLIGHSEGGLIAWMCAAQNPHIRFVISLAGMGVPLLDILQYQSEAISRAKQLPEAQIQSNNYLNNRIYTIVQNSKNKDVAAKKLNDFILEYTRDMTAEQRAEAHLTPTEILMMNKQVLSPWFYQLFKINPATYMRKVSCPVLALNGDKDLQVEALPNLANMKKYLKKNDLHHFEVILGVNHLFQECEVGIPDEYGKIEQTFSPQVLKLMGEWLDSSLESFKK